MNASIQKQIHIVKNSILHAQRAGIPGVDYKLQEIVSRIIYLLHVHDGYMKITLAFASAVQKKALSDKNSNASSIRKISGHSADEISIFQKGTIDVSATLIKSSFHRNIQLYIIAWAMGWVKLDTSDLIITEYHLQAASLGFLWF